MMTKAKVTMLFPGTISQQLKLQTTPSEGRW
jgi:hypothetical protein